MAYPHVPFPVNVPVTSTLFHAQPFTSDATSGWASSCDNCTDSAWSTSAPNSVISFTFWGWDVAFDGRVQGDMSVKLVLDGMDVSLSPSLSSLFQVNNLNNLKEHSLSLTVQTASPGSSLTISQARINASTFSDQELPSTQWNLPSNDGVFQWTGFQQHPSIEGSVSPTTYISSNPGDTGSITYNGSTVLIYGPCSPTSGLLRVTIDGGDEQTVNTSSPISSPNCLLYQSRGYSALSLHTLSFRAESTPVAINHLAFFRVLERTGRGNHINAGAIVGGVMGGIVAIIVSIIAYSMRSKKTRQKINRAFSVFCS